MSERDENLYLDQLTVSTQESDDSTIEGYLYPEEWDRLTNQINTTLKESSLNIPGASRELLNRYPPLLQLITQSSHKKDVSITRPQDVLASLRISNMMANSPETNAAIQKVTHILMPEQSSITTLDFGIMKTIISDIDRTHSQWATLVLQQMEQFMYFFPGQREEIMQFATDDLLSQVRRDIDNVLTYYNEEGFSNIFHTMGQVMEQDQYKTIANIVFSNIERMQMFFPQEIQKLRQIDKLRSILHMHQERFRRDTTALTTTGIEELGKATWYLALLDAQRLEVTPEGVQLILSPQTTHAIIDPVPTEYA